VARRSRISGPAVGALVLGVLLSSANVAPALGAETGTQGTAATTRGQAAGAALLVGLQDDASRSEENTA